MTQLRVWAPHATSVQVRTAAGDFAMHPQPEGWWNAPFTPAEQPDYAFLINGEGPFPDPRSAWQPHGVHGASRRVDHSAYPWRDEYWQPPPFETAVLYELHIGTFTPAGTFRGAIDRLDHLRELGVTHVELMPVNEFSGEHGWGYDGVDLYAPHHVYGTPDELKQLVDACHARGLAVLLDVVYNHLGPCGNYLQKFGPYFTERYHTPWGAAVNLDDAGSDEVRRFFFDNACMWLRDYHFDGLRLDAVHAIVDTSALHFLEQLALEVRVLQAQLDRSLVLIAESDLNDPRLLWPRQRGGYGLSAQWSDDFHHALHAVLSGERTGYYVDFGTIADIATALQQGYVYAGRYSNFRKRTHGRPPVDVLPRQLLGYLQNHDQIGNRAAGERSTHLMSRGRLKLGAALVLLSPFTPMLFQGEEWGARTPFQYFTSHEDAALAQQVRDGRREEFAQFNWSPESVPDPQDPLSYLRSKLDWSELAQAPHREMLEWYRQLIALRREIPIVHDEAFGGAQVRFDEEAQWITLTRGNLVVAGNVGTGVQRVPVQRHLRKMRLRSDPTVRLEDSAVELPPDSVAVLLQG